MRQNARRRRAAISLQKRQQAGLTLAAHVETLLHYCHFGSKLRKSGCTLSFSSRIFAAYYPAGSEIDTRPLMKALAEHGNQIGLPAFDDNKQMVFRQYCADKPLEAGLYNLQQPAKEAKQIIPDILLLPLTAFSEKGDRLGQGGGHYDQYLAKLAGHNSKPLCIGLAYQQQKWPIWATEPHDIPLQAVLTEDGLTIF